LQQSLLRIVCRLTPNQRKFVAEVIGTFIVVVLATGSVVIDAKTNGILGIPFIAFAPFVGVAIGVYLFGKISMAHFNPAVTVGFLITKHITKIQLLYYLTAEIIGALLASLFVKSAIGSEAYLGANAPNYAYPLPLIFGIEILASGLLMAVILVVVYTNGLKGFSGIVIGGIVGLDIFFLAFISGASMNPARSLAPALLSGVMTNLWLYWTATLIGTSAVALLLRKKLCAARQNRLWTWSIRNQSICVKKAVGCNALVHVIHFRQEGKRTKFDSFFTLNPNGHAISKIQKIRAYMETTI
jgi:aquaporin Z